MTPFQTVCLGLLSILYAWPARAGFVVESVSHTPIGWTYQSAPEPDKPITLQIGLTMRNLDRLVDTLIAVSTPGGSCYGNHLTRAEADGLVKPSDLSERLVVEWLTNSGVKSVHSDGTWVTFETNVTHANTLLEAQFETFKKDGMSKVRTMEYSVPEDLAEHIDVIHPTTYFGPSLPVPVKMIDVVSRRTAIGFGDLDPDLLTHHNKERQVIQSCSPGVTAKCVRDMYKVDYVPEANSTSRLGFGSFLNESARFDDLVAYQAFNELPSKSFEKVNINNAQDDQSPESSSQAEANLDVQMLFGVAQTLSVTEYLTGGSPPFVQSLDIPEGINNTNEPYLPYYQYLLSKENDELPQVISNSYGEPEQSVPKRYALRTCWMAALLGVRGISIIESSGDVGVGGACKANDGTGRREYVGQFPSTCPYITGVGGTESIAPEIAWTGSSGGFSDYWASKDAPWQLEAVHHFLEKGLSADELRYHSQFFPIQGRGYPDVSAHSASPFYIISKGGKKVRSGGASAAAPVVAAIVGLLNDIRFRQDPPLPPLGFLNPWIYKVGNGMFTDITTGKAIGCTGKNLQTGKKYENAGIIPWASWNATEGWDPASGWGVPDFQKMKVASLEAEPGKGCDRPWLQTAEE